ncbi:MAG: NAD(+) diphosphatase [Chloroflexi bacterium]|nr:NAD(+) diphosphatase [Chloroflexota bacterium]
MEFHEPMTFAGGTADRAGQRRLDEAWLAEARQAAATRILVVRSSSQLLVAGEGRLGSLGAHLVDPAAEMTFLGVDGDGAAIFVYDFGAEDPALRQAQDGLAFEELRPLAAVLPAEDAALAAHAVAMAGWRRRHGFCSVCGGRNEVLEAGHCLHCLACGTRHYPRTDPSVIMIVSNGDRCVLARRPGGRWWTVLAGFVEPGETLEQAVAREVQEEVGLRVTSARYLGSQPWPFPANLMLGFAAQAEYGPIVLDGELEEARWFTRRELLDGIANQTINVPTPVTIAHHLIQAWLTQES